MQRDTQCDPHPIDARPQTRGTLALIMALVAIASLAMVTSADGDNKAAAVVLLASLVSSIAGFAFAALAGSALAYLRFDPVQAVTTMAFCSIAMQSYAVWQLRAAIRWRALKPMLAAGAIIEAIAAVGIDHQSPEAAAAASAYRGLRTATRHLLSASETARESLSK